MDIILLEDVKNVGYTDDVVSVKPGYARNFLIPTGKAVVANKENLTEVEKKNAEKRKEEEKLTAELAKVTSSIEGANISIPAKVGTSGKLFGSVTTLQLSDAINEATGYEIDRRKIEILDDINELGNYKAVVHLPQDNDVEFSFEVVEE